ncbi:predicted protein [Naegleria gruberi]|nr:uncharacterized protein NAEGRDRAFT_76790 [Naegleria gruberi]EFC35558.1 predicted protein [Naegleria gruberi]|eukprot:XP_002668302.1 predicted protein [Naegleria gruberi strain NEG-M]
MEASGSFPNLDEFVVWQPENDCRGVIRYYGVHLGWQRELLYTLMKTCAILTFGFLYPFVHQYYNPKFLEQVRYGRGQFVVIPPQVASQLRERNKKTQINYNVQYSSQYPIIGQPITSPVEMRFEWTADTTDMFCRYFLGAVINNFTFGFFRCCYWYWYIFNFYNDHSFIILDGKSHI